MVLGTNRKLVDIYNKYTRKSDFAGKMYVTIVNFTVTLFLTLPALELHLNKHLYEVQNNSTDFKNKPIPLSTWMPFNKNDHYILSYIITGVTTVYGGFYTCFTDVFFYALIIFCTGQIKILQNQLREFKKPSNSKTQNKPGLCFRKNTLPDEEETNINLRKCFEQHKVIIK